MENNLIRISVGFRFTMKEGKARLEELFGDQRCYSLEFIVPRDLTLRQLLTGIRFGLDKERKKSADAAQLHECWMLFHLSLYKCKYDDTADRFHIQGQSAADAQSAEEGYLLDQNGSFLNLRVQRYHTERVKRLQLRGYKPGEPYRPNLSHLDLPLHKLGFTTSTELNIVSVNRKEDMDQGSGRSFGTKQIIDAFNPAHTPEIRYPYPEYNISTRERHQFDKEPVRLLPPGNPPQKPEFDLMTSVIPSVLSMAMMGVLRSANSGFDMGTVIMALAMGGVTSLTTTFRYRGQMKKYRRDLEKWRTDYVQYANSTMLGLEQRTAADAKKLDELYPDAWELAHDQVFRYEDSIFSRSRNDDDFLTFRLGTSNRVESLFPIEGESKEEVFSEAGYLLDQKGLQLFLNEEAPKTKLKNLSQLPDEIRKRYKYMSEAPLLYSLKRSSSLGIVDRELFGRTSNRSCESMRGSCANLLIKRMLFELCYYHSHEDLQIVMFMPREKRFEAMEAAIHDYKYLPHFRELFHKRSQFVFNDENAGNVLSELLKILNDRSKSSSGTEEGDHSAGSYPHIVMVVLEEYNLKEHAFAQYLPQAPAADAECADHLGISFVFASAFKEYLPPYCSHVIRVDGKNARMTLTPRDDVSNPVPFVPWNSVQKPCFGEEKVRRAAWQELIADRERLANAGNALSVYRAGFEFFSGIYYTQIAQNGKVPTSVDIFTLMGLETDGITGWIEEAWDLKQERECAASGKKAPKRRHDVASTLKVPLGKTDSGIAYLNLHEKEDGPHMLVAGTTGSGKSETVISWLLGLCMYYRPDELNLLLVDMKGGGFTKRLGDLPHVVGTVTDVDGDENGTGAEYMLRRFLEAITYEVKRRKMLLNKMLVDNVDDYIKACRDIDSHIKGKGVAPQSEAAEEMRRMAKEEKLSHLILVIDEFTELKRFTSEASDVDFIGQITTIARVGRSLGYHICLISQNIQGAITEDISVNSKSRLCLKVATRQASKEMIGNDLAADPSMPGMGRAYLLVGTGSKFEYFQSAYSGAKITLGPKTAQSGRVEKIDYTLVRANLSGTHTDFYVSGSDNPDVKAEMNRLREAGKLKTQLEVMVEAIQAIYEKNRKDKNGGVLMAPHQVFLPPLPERVVLLKDKTKKILK